MCGNIPERSEFRYISEFKNIGYYNRKNYPKRKKPSQAVQVVRKVLKKAKDRKRSGLCVILSEKLGLKKILLGRFLKVKV